MTGYALFDQYLHNISMRMNVVMKRTEMARKDEMRDRRVGEECQC